LFNNFRRKAIGDNQDLQEMMISLNQDFKSKFKKVKEYNMTAWKVDLSRKRGFLRLFRINMKSIARESSR